MYYDLISKAVLYASARRDLYQIYLTDGPGLSGYQQR